MKANEFVIMSECVEVGARAGVNRAFKHTDEPSMEHIIREVESEVMNAICEKFTFETTTEE